MARKVQDTLSASQGAHDLQCRGDADANFQVCRGRTSTQASPLPRSCHAPAILRSTWRSSSATRKSRCRLSAHQAHVLGRAGGGSGAKGADPAKAGSRGCVRWGHARLASHPRSLYLSAPARRWRQRLGAGPSPDAPRGPLRTRQGQGGVDSPTRVDLVPGCCWYAALAQLVRALDCGSRGPRSSPGGGTSKIKGFSAFGPWSLVPCDPPKSTPAAKLSPPTRSQTSRPISRGLTADDVGIPDDS